eukprot:Gregarina_sp_Poly_1__4493@NODE_2414_length_2162_cov_42_874463_g1535_i0_p2_GENE_NODE_2414_length_2162_cov_42_874463_g1535_i0NODE_2414_length_2162_cov_42_874463_g1535_i0_p2_ORF_typecomplete_len167_score10_00DUF4040/PF13244_6/2_4e02DUF4040/PF13244_6/0_99_NODE_2414_length_2162_cov_42_874463_g1535_i0257757
MLPSNSRSNLFRLRYSVERNLSANSTCRLIVADELTTEEPFPSVGAGWTRQSLSGLVSVETSAMACLAAHKKSSLVSMFSSKRMKALALLSILAKWSIACFPLVAIVSTNSRTSFSEYPLLEFPATCAGLTCFEIGCLWVVGCFGSVGLGLTLLFVRLELFFAWVA